ncbi:hypothetical protein [Bifidobacterium pseudolongum]|uniref:hypothetical protein n=1 Tax=Bifidobacterium pseudolongum TaxID=1694 RepID=UPI0010203AC3|nr:hypothetical protein [Bifidobacterium pseudolongum]RYQ42342.1 hypothetical protein PG1805B_1175 [Bifidobacterium pseudolongum subsp. globosum]
MAKKNVGTCHVCGKQGELTFEHIPPRSSGNDHKMHVYNGENVDNIKSSLFGIGTPSGTYAIRQQGMGFYALCANCNNLFGRHYDKPYARLGNAIRSDAKSMREALPEDGRGYISFDLSGFLPLSFIKRVIANFCVINSTESMTDCRDFLLDPASTALPNHYRLRMLIVPEPTKACMSGWMKVLFGENIDDLDSVTLSCMLVPPFAFVLYDRDHSNMLPDLDGDITSMASVDSSQRPNMTLNLPIMSAKIAAIPAQWILPAQSLNTQ